MDSAATIADNHRTSHGLVINRGEWRAKTGKFGISAAKVRGAEDAIGEVSEARVRLSGIKPLLYAGPIQFEAVNRLRFGGGRHMLNALVGQGVGLQ